MSDTIELLPYVLGMILLPLAVILAIALFESRR